MIKTTDHMKSQVSVVEKNWSALTPVNIQAGTRNPRERLPK